jgi:hypothetical protein
MFVLSRWKEVDSTVTVYLPTFQRMKLAYIGTYPPRECGIGTFTQNLVHSMVLQNAKDAPTVEGFVVALNDHDLQYPYPEEVKLVIQQEHQAGKAK